MSHMNALVCDKKAAAPSKPYHYACQACHQVFKTPDNPPTRIALFSPLQPAYIIAEYCPHCAPNIISTIQTILMQELAQCGGGEVEA